jgi:glycosyltransferase involved in cell wall biosynthesis
MPAVRAECPGVRFLVLGEGPARASLEARAAELGVREAVVFAGTTNDLPPYYQAADIFVMLPDAEAGSIALLEAMASELPVVVSEAGGLGEVVGKRQGLRVDAQDATAIRSALVRLARDPRSREAMGRAGRQLVQQEYAWEALATRLLRIIADGHGYVP